VLKLLFSLETRRMALAFVDILAGITAVRMAVVEDSLIGIATSMANAPLFCVAQMRSHQKEKEHRQADTPMK
jgi:hypothetical protein